MTRVDTFTYDRNGNIYQRRSRKDAVAGLVLAEFASAAIMGALPYFSKPFQKQIVKERINNPQYKDTLFKAFEKSGLKEKGVDIIHMELSENDKILLRTRQDSLIQHLDVKLGRNAFYSTGSKVVCLNTDKAAISGFHELGHAMNHLTSKFGKLLQKCRKPGYAIAGAMGTIALFSRNKPKDSDRNLWDVIRDNCGKIAVFAMLPTVIEECMASIKGVKLAKLATQDKSILKSIKGIYRKALMSYAGFMAVTGLSVFITSKITEKFTRPQKLDI